MLADFCFADLLLYVPTKDDRWLIVGQVRPATGQTVYHTDWVGTFANVERAGGARRRRSRPGEITEGDVAVEDAGGPGADARRSRCAATGQLDRRADPRVGASAAGRPPGELERDLPRRSSTASPAMIAEGSFPFPARGGDSTAAPARRRRRDDPRRRGAGDATCRRTPTRRCTASASTPTPSACASPSSASTTTWCARPSSTRIAGHRGVRAGGRRRAAVPLHADPGRRRGRRRRAARPRRHRRCASATACCSARTPRSARSTTG